MYITTYIHHYIINTLLNACILTYTFMFHINVYVHVHINVYIHFNIHVYIHVHINVYILA